MSALPVVRLLAALALAGCSSALYHQEFASPEALADLEFTDPAAWRLSAAGGVPSLELHAASDYRPPVRSPLSIALLPVTVDDFVFEADLMQTGREYAHRDLCLFFGYRDPAHFYYVHLATTPDQNAHNVFVVDGAPRRPLAPVAATGIRWGDSQWHHARVERRGADIRVCFDGRQVFAVTDDALREGRLGLGSFDDTGRFARVRVSQPE